MTHKTLALLAGSLIAASTFFFPPPATGQESTFALQCRPCLGLPASQVDTQILSTADLPEGSAILGSRSADLSQGTPTLGSSPDVSSPTIDFWRVSFASTPPLLQNETALAAELETLAQIARASHPLAHFEIVWSPSSGEWSARDYAYLLKRASVAISGATTEGQVFTEPRAAAVTRELYGEDVAAYVDGWAVSGSPTLPTAESLLDLRTLAMELDPGVRIVVRSIAMPAEPGDVLATSAEMASRLADIVLFDHDTDASQPIDSQIRLAPFLFAAREFFGDVSPDSYSKPSGVDGVWSFVRGEDLSLRVVVRTPPGAEKVRLQFTDSQLLNPVTYDFATGETSDLFGGMRTRNGYRLEVSEPPPVFVVGLERMLAADLEGIEGVEERVEVEDTRRMPVEEILRRLQAFEDDQSRRLLTYTATNTMALRFQLGTGVQSLDTTFKGAFFFEQGAGFDWAWQEFFVNGVKWRDKSIPQIPLIQPEKATAMPTSINFDKKYRYRLRGTGMAEGRECWVVDFEPAVEIEPGSSLYQGTLWVDRKLYVRVKTRAVQLGLEGDVTSNEETQFFQPLDGNGTPVDWSRDAYYLSTRTLGQQILSVLNTATVVEREMVLTDIDINPENYQQRLEVMRSSDATMVRDTDKGLRYLVTDKDSGERVVQDELDATRLFLVGGVFYDDSQDFPLPLAGVNWLSFDLKGTGTQANVFWGGPLLIGDIASPSLWGSKWEAGADFFALAIAGTDTIYRSGEEAISEDVESLRPNIDLTLGRPIGNFFKLQFEYSIGFNRFDTADDTAPDFILPEDHTDHEFTLRGVYNRKGYRFRLAGTQAIRSDWEFWGLPGNTEFDPSHDEYTTWSAGLGKTWHLPKFQKIGAEIEYVGGDNLDRFSKYQFGFFSDIRVHGYQSDLIRAEEAYAAHLSYGVNVGDIIRIDLLGDVAWATDELTGLEDEMLAGVGIAGTFIGPWRTVVNLDIGVPVAGPDDGFSAFIAFLKLFK